MVQLSQEENQRRKSAILKTLWIILFLNLGVALAKYIYGLVTKSVAMQADGIHSIFDSAGNVIGIIGLSLASKPADTEHPYGHAKFETYASVLIGIFLLFAAYNIGSTAIAALMAQDSQIEVGISSFLLMLVSLVINLFITIIERRQAKNLRSEILEADALHTLSDALVSISVIVSLALVSFGFTKADAIVSLFVCAAIFYTAYSVFKQANASLSDRARIPYEDIALQASKIEGVDNIHAIRTRGTEGEVYVDLHMLVDPEMSVAHAHALADKLEALLKREFPQVVDVVVHIEPDSPQQRLEAAQESLA